MSRVQNWEIYGQAALQLFDRAQKRFVRKLLQ